MLQNIISYLYHSCWLLLDTTTCNFMFCYNYNDPPAHRVTLNYLYPYEKSFAKIWLGYFRASDWDLLCFGLDRFQPVVRLRNSFCCLNSTFSRDITWFLSGKVNVHISQNINFYPHIDAKDLLKQFVARNQTVRRIWGNVKVLLWTSLSPSLLLSNHFPSPWVMTVHSSWPGRFHFQCIFRSRN